MSALESSAAERQLNKELELSVIHSDDVTGAADEVTDDLPGPSVTGDDKSQHGGVDLEGGNGSDDYASVSAENEPETVGDDVEVPSSSDTPDANQQVNLPDADEFTESGDLVPSTSSSASGTDAPSSDVEVADVGRQELRLTSTTEDEQGGMNRVMETKGQAELEDGGQVVADSVENDLNVDSHSEQEVIANHEPDSSTRQTDEDQSPHVTEKREQLVHSETAADSDERRTLTGAGDEMTSQQNGEVDRDEATLANDSNSKVTESAEVIEEVKVTYEASAKQLDLLSRLALLREKAAQRKAEQGSDENDHEVSAGENRGPSRPSDDSAGPLNRSDSPQQKCDASNASTKTADETVVDADAEQHGHIRGLPSLGAEIIEDPDKLASRAVEGHRETTDSPSVTTRDHTRETEALQPPASEEIRGSLTSGVFLEQSENCRSDFHDIITSEKEAKGPNSRTEPVHDVSNTQKSADDEPTSMDSRNAELSPDRTGLNEATGELPDWQHSEVSHAGRASNLDKLSEESQPKSVSTSESDQEEAEKITEGKTSTATPTALSSGHDSTVEPLGELTQRPCDDAANYDSDFDYEFADSGVLQLLSDIHSVKRKAADGPGYLYAFIDRPRGRFTIGASRSPTKRLRQAAVFNPDITSLCCEHVSKRRAAVGVLRQRLLGIPPSSDDVIKCLPASCDWFTGIPADDVITELVRHVAVACETNS